MTKNICALLTAAFLAAAFLAAAFLAAVPLAAADFGMSIDQTLGAGGVGEAAVDYQLSFVPRISFLLGDNSDLFMSAAVSAGYEKEAFFVPELLRTELSLRFGSAKFSAGRMEYAAPFAAVASGLFDGMEFWFDSPAGMFSAGAWYTGLLYKKSAKIIMTEEEAGNFYDPIDTDDIAGTYFAPKRLIAALGWEHLSVAELLRTKLAFIAQADLNGSEAGSVHSQYLVAKIGVPINRFLFEISGALELAQKSGGFNIGLASEVGFSWMLPSAFPSRISLAGYFSSGKAESGYLDAFTPVTTQFQGTILEAHPAGVSSFSLDYTARFHQKFSFSANSTYVVLDDLGTFKSYPVDREAESDGFFLGNEFFARLSWSPFSDLQLNLGGGVFLPAMGDAMPDRGSRWRVELAAILAVF